MFNRRIQATGVLILMIIGFALTCGNGQWWVKIINAGFLAGTIGGLADWFAVTALFRKPLGFISFKTEILPRNRQRIIEEIVKFLGQDLLNAKYLIEQLQKISLAEIIKSYGSSPSVQAEMKFICHNLGEILGSKGKDVLSELLALGKAEKPDEAKAGKWADEIYRILVNKSNDRLLIEIWLILINAAEYLLNKSFIQQFLDYHIENIKEKYVGNHFARSIALGFLDLSGKTLADKFIVYLENLKVRLQAKDSRSARYLQLKTARKLRTYLNSSEAQKKLYDFIAGNLSLEKLKGDTVDQREVTALAEKEIYGYLMNNLQDDDRIHALAEWLKLRIAKFIVDNSEFQLNYIRNELNRYSNEELVSLVESKVGDDLQMIRINGSLVGSFAGMLLYALSLGAERLWG